MLRPSLTPLSSSSSSSTTCSCRTLLPDSHRPRPQSPLVSAWRIDNKINHTTEQKHYHQTLTWPFSPAPCSSVSRHHSSPKPSTWSSLCASLWPSSCLLPRLAPRSRLGALGAASASPCPPYQLKQDKITFYTRYLIPSMSLPRAYTMPLL